MKRSGFREKTYDEKIAILKEKQAKARKIPKRRKKPSQSTTGRKKGIRKTQRASKMLKKKKLLEKYDLPMIAHSRWGTAKRPTDTDLLRGMLWTVFSKFIRDRDQEKPCISCGRTFDVKQAGHFVPVGGSSVDLWFDEKNVHGECEGCNGFDQFHLIPMRKNLILKYGEEAVEELEARRYKTTKLDDDFYVEKIKYYYDLTS